MMFVVRECDVFYCKLFYGLVCCFGFEIFLKTMCKLSVLELQCLEYLILIKVHEKPDISFDMLRKTKKVKK